MAEALVSSGLSGPKRKADREVSLGPLEILIIILILLPMVALVVGTVAAVRYLYLSWRR